MIKELATGLGVTLENLFKKPFTVKYPEEKLEMFPRFRGLHILTRHADGLERCVTQVTSLPHIDDHRRAHSSEA